MREHGDVLAFGENLRNGHARRARVEVDGVAFLHERGRVPCEADFRRLHDLGARRHGRQCRAAFIVDGAAVHERHDIRLREPPQVAPHGHRCDVKARGEFRDDDALVPLQGVQKRPPPFSGIHDGFLRSVPLKSV